MIVRFLSVAEVEFAEAAAYYEDKDGGLGDTFIEHVAQSVRYLERHPLIGHLIDKRVRKVSLRRFPYNIIYFPGSDEIVVVAIAHHRREPGYWRDRI